jgi:glycosyltransferase involved in cell wall biosynthesis
MNRGGIETWLMQVLRNIDRRKYQFDFLVQRNEPGCFDEEIKSLGSKIIQSAAVDRLCSCFNCIKDFRRILTEYGPYDAIHCHGGSVYGPLLWQAKLADVPMRIMHSHNLQRHWHSGPFRAVAGWIGNIMIKKYANIGLGCSKDACAALFGVDWKQKKCKVLYHGIDLSPYRIRDRSGVRQELNVPQDAIVIGHVGRFNAVKNHKFIVETAEAVIKKNSKFRFVLVGDGVLRKEIEQIAAARKLSEYILFTGVREDVPRILSGFDLFILPSFHEGLGLVLVEAQAAGLRCLVNVTVPNDIEIIKENCDWLNIKNGAKVWADKIIELSEKNAVDREQALHKVEASAFNIYTSVLQLTAIYERHFKQDYN